MATATARYDMEKGGTGGQEYYPPAPPPVAEQMYPQREGKREWVPWFVPVIVATNIAMFAAAMYVKNCPAHAAPARRDGVGAGSCVARGFLHCFSFQPLSENPLLGPSSGTLQKLGALVWEKVVHEHQGWRLLTCIWLHAGVVHLLANMLSLVLIGLRLEQQFGYDMHRLRNAIIYIVSGVGGSVLSSLFIRNNISVGVLPALCSDSLEPCYLSSSPTGPSTQTRSASSSPLLFCRSARQLMHKLQQIKFDR